VARMGKRKVHIWFWLGNLRERGHWEDLGVDGRTVLEWVLHKSGGRAWNGLIWLRMGTGGGLL
jgi:hypothetical protein